MKRGMEVNSAPFLTRLEGMALALRPWGGWRRGRGGEDPVKSFLFLLVSLDLHFPEPSFPALRLKAKLDPGFQAGIYVNQGALSPEKPALSIRDRDRGAWHMLGDS